MTIQLLKLPVVVTAVTVTLLLSGVVVAGTPSPVPSAGVVVPGPVPAAGLVVVPFPVKNMEPLHNMM